MNRQQLEQRLAALEPTDRKKYAALVKEVETEARQSPRAAVQLWQLGDKTKSRQASRLLSDLEELAIVPLLEASSPTASDQRLWSLQVVVDEVVQLQQRVVNRLQETMLDRSSLPSPPSRTPMEETLPARRMCDEAYLMLRRLLVLSEDGLAQIMSAEAFLHLPDAEKDVVIGQLKESKVWARLVDES